MSRLGTILESKVLCIFLTDCHGKNVFIVHAGTPTIISMSQNDWCYCEDGAIIGGRSVFKPGVHVGRNSVIGMGSVARCAPETVVMGHPATVRYSGKNRAKKWNVS
jgi:acetyltransferase-like isoleucine patch superfamily enzyme